MRRTLKGIIRRFTSLLGFPAAAAFLLLLILLSFLLYGTILAALEYALSWFASLGIVGTMLVFGALAWVVWAVVLSLYALPWVWVSMDQERTEGMIPWLALGFTIVTGLALWFHPWGFDWAEGFLVGMVAAWVTNVIFSTTMKT